VIPARGAWALGAALAAGIGLWLGLLLREELDALDRLRVLRRIRAGDIPEIEPSRPLQRSERCYYEAPARLLKERNLRSFQRDGTRYGVRGLVVDKEGVATLAGL
jgi:hypothetical protein